VKIIWKTLLENGENQVKIKKETRENLRVFFTTVNSFERNLWQAWMPPS
jgi:hypothetical protein